MNEDRSVLKSQVQPVFWKVMDLTPVGELRNLFSE